MFHALKYMCAVYTCIWHIRINTHDTKLKMNEIMVYDEHKRRKHVLYIQL